MKVELHGVLEDVEQDQFVELPLGDYLVWEFHLLQDEHIDLPLLDLVVER